MAHWLGDLGSWLLNLFGRRVPHDDEPLIRATTIRKCRIVPRVPCPYRWDRLQPTDDDEVRFCDTCNSNVYLCRTDEETVAHALAGHCVARLDAVTPQNGFLGMVDVEELEASPTEDEEEIARAWRREQGIFRALDNDLTNIVEFCADCGYPMPQWRRSCYVCEGTSRKRRGR